jgi:Ca2+-binding RTX toxin-like protein
MARVIETGDARQGTSTQYKVSAGDEFRASVSDGNDHDWIKITLKAGIGYRFRIREDDSEGDGLTDGHLQLRDADGSTIGDSSPLLGFTPTKTGTFYLDSFSNTGLDYRVGNGGYVVDTLAEVAPNTKTRATTSAKKDYRGTLDYGNDHDWLKIVLTGKASYVFRIVEDDSKGPGVTDGRIQLRDSDGDTIGSDDGVINFTPSKKGVYFLDVFSNTGLDYRLQNGQYRVETVKEIAGDARTLGTLAPGGNHRGNIDFSSDHDWLKVKLQKGISYEIRIREDDSKGPGLTDGLVQLRNGKGDALGLADDGLLFRPAKSGFYFLDAFSNTGIDYRINNGDYLLSLVAQGIKKTGTTKADKMVGGPGDDTFDGRAGNDTLEGAKGADKLKGGLGADKFVFRSLADSTVNKTGRDVISDFSQAQRDTIDLRPIDANTKKKGSNEAFAFIGKKAFSGKAGELRFEKEKGVTYVYGDVNGDRKADFAIALKGGHELTKDAFIL